MKRRAFSRTIAGVATSGLLSAKAATAKPGANDKIVIASMGMGGRGTKIASGFEALDGVEIKAVYDVDRTRAAAAALAVGKVNGRTIGHGQDFRKILEDPEIDALTITCSNHWHGPAAVMAAAAGKHVYVEKPCSHNPHEGELMVAAARKYDIRMQHGTQRRSRPALREGIARLHEGAIGNVYYAKCYYRGKRPSLGNGVEIEAPDDLDYDLWQGPAPRRPYLDNRIHYNWHWFWHWGNGELGNNGVHHVDIARFVLGVDFPEQVTSSGGRYRYPEDDQETPDTQDAVFKFPGGKAISWEALSCHPQWPGKKKDIWFYGSEGSAAITGVGYQLFDLDGKLIGESEGESGEKQHLENFISSIREGTPLNAEIEEGHKSTLLCHLGNIAYRNGRTLNCNPANGKILDDVESMALWSRDYEKGWEVEV